MNETELKPCPFCGGEAVFARDSYSTLECVKCTGCHARSLCATEAEHDCIGSELSEAQCRFAYERLEGVDK